MSKRSVISLVIAAVLSVVSLSSSTISPAVADDEVVHYTVTGVVKALPGNGRAKNEILIKHDPIPDYRDLSGKVVGMMAMTMPFYLADGTTLTDISPGDKVKFILEARTEPVFSEKVTSISKLPKDEQ